MVILEVEYLGGIPNSGKMTDAPELNNRREVGMEFKGEWRIDQ